MQFIRKNILFLKYFSNINFIYGEISKKNDMIDAIGNLSS